MLPYWRYFYRSQAETQLETSFQTEHLILQFAARILLGGKTADSLFHER
jgi:hypothetical protein